MLSMESQLEYRIMSEKGKVLQIRGFPRFARQAEIFFHSSHCMPFSGRGLTCGG